MNTDRDKNESTELEDLREALEILKPYMRYFAIHMADEEYDKLRKVMGGLNE